MSILFEDLCEGLQEAIDYENGNVKAKKTVFMITPVNKYDTPHTCSIQPQPLNFQEDIAYNTFQPKGDVDGISGRN